MKRVLIAVMIVSLGWTATTWAQQSDTTEPSDVRPSAWVNAARARHQVINDARVNAARGGERPGTFEGYDGNAGSSFTNTGGLSSLLDLAGMFTGSGSLNNITSLLGNLGGSGGTGATSTGGSPSGSTTGGSQYTIEDLLRLRDAMQGNSTSKESSRAQSSTISYETRSGSGGIGRLPKIDSLAQSLDGQDRSFGARWADRMAQTLFTSLAIGFQSKAFIDFLKDSLRPVFFPVAGTGEDSSNSDSSSSGDDSSGSSGSGGIEDLNPSDSNGSGDSGSLI